MSDATLRDITSPPNPPAATSTVEPVVEPVVAAAPSADADAAEVGRILLESGISKEQLNDVMSAPGHLASLRQLIANNPQELINLLDRSNPEASRKLLDTAADEYVKRYGKEDGAKVVKGDANSNLMSEVEGLRNELNTFRTQREQEQSRIALAQVKSRYDARVDDLFNQLPKESGLTGSERKALRARVDAELSQDDAIVRRVASGNFVDVPHKFKAILDEWVGDRKAATVAADNRRKGISDNANPEFTGGPNPFMPSDKAFADSWDNTEEAFAKALTQASR